MSEDTVTMLNRLGKLLEDGEWKKAIDSLANKGTSAGGIRYTLEKLNFYPSPEAVEYIDRAVRRRNAEVQALRKLNKLFG